MDVLKKTFILFSFFFFNRVCFGQSNNRTASLEDTIIDKIAMLPEVIRADTYRKKVTKGKRHLVTFISSYPSKAENYYMLKVAEDNGLSFHAWYLFIVHPNTYKIEYFDPAGGKGVPLHVWRKRYEHY